MLSAVSTRLAEGAAGAWSPGEVLGPAAGGVVVTEGSGVGAPRRCPEPPKGAVGREDGGV